MSRIHPFGLVHFFSRARGLRAQESERMVQASDTTYAGSTMDTTIVRLEMPESDFDTILSFLRQMQVAAPNYPLARVALEATHAFGEARVDKVVL